MEPSKNQTIPAQYTGKARNQVTTENSHIMHSTNTAENVNVKVPDIQLRKCCYEYHDL
jgi:hypothetical protein